jgi:hypothetical protein
MGKPKITFNLNELFFRKIHLTLLAGEKLGYNFKNPEKKIGREELSEQVRKASELAKKWAKQEKWVCIKSCKELQYKTTKK